MPHGGMGAHQSSRPGKCEWFTPPEIIEALGPFATDPCTSIDAPFTTADTQMNIHDDGLSYPWHGMVWMNPPYSNNVGAWMKRLSEHGEGIALVFARTETDWFVKWVWNCADGILFLYNRLYFYHIDGTRAKHNAGAPSCLVAYGEEAVLRLRTAGLEGALVEHWKGL